MTDGSGCLEAISILETKYKENMEKDDAINLAIESIEAGIWNDLGSGSNVDVCVITKEKSEILRNIRKHNFSMF